MTNPLTTDVSVIGLGRMGTALARAFVAAGRRVTVWNRDAAKAQALSNVRPAATLAEAIQASSLIVVCVTRYATWSDLISQLPEGGLQGKTILQLSSGAADEALHLAARQGQLGARSLDGAIMAFPSAVGTAGAEIMVCGDEAAWLDHADLIGGLGAIDYLGVRISDANAWDSAVLIFAFGGVLSAIQAGAILAAAGASLEGLSERLSATTRALPAMIGEAADGMIRRDYPGGEVTLETLQVLWRQMQAFLARSGARTDFVNVFETLSQSAISAGHGLDYFSALYEVMRPTKPITAE